MTLPPVYSIALLSCSENTHWFEFKQFKFYSNASCIKYNCICTKYNSGCIKYTNNCIKYLHSHWLKSPFFINIRPPLLKFDFEGHTSLCRITTYIYKLWGNIIKQFTNFNKRTNTLLYKNIFLTLYSRKGWCFCGVWEMGGETYTQREDFFPYLHPGARGVNSCKFVRDDLCSVACLSHDCDSLPLSKSDRVFLITWSPSGYTPVQPECTDAPWSSYLLIKKWQLIKAHGVTRNEPKIHVICYITLNQWQK